jgi:hypothetical protein
MLVLENFVVILGLIGFVVLVDEYFGVIVTVIGAGLAIAGGIYAYNNFDPTGLSVLAGIVALTCAVMWNKRREQRNANKKARDAIAKANAAVQDSHITGKVVALGRVNEGSGNAPANHAKQDKAATVIDTGEADGTPYTRYSDGSIETQTPDGGTVRLRTAADMANFIAQSEHQSPVHMQQADAPVAMAPLYHNHGSRYLDDLVALGRTRDLESGVERHPVCPPSVSILQSGVVDGMHYTLYSDGSIDAKLPQGTLRFASIDELRNHIEESA